MNVLKSEMKQLVAHEVGVRVDDALENAKHELGVLEGRQTAFTDGSKAAVALLTAVDEDVTSGKFDLTTAEHVKRYITRCSLALQNLAVQATNLRIAQTGRISGFEHTVKLIGNIIEDEKRKAEAAALAAAKASEVSVSEGAELERPLDAVEPPIKAQRLAAVEDPAPKGRKPRAANSR